MATFAELKARFQGSGSAVRPTLQRVLPSELPALDAMLGGGFPCGSLVTLEGSAGRWSIAARLLAQATRGGLAAVIDEGELYPPGLEEAGVRLDRLLVVPARTPLGIARAADILIRSRACCLVVMPHTSLRAMVWTRLAGLAHRAGTLLIVIATRVAETLGGAAKLRVHCAIERVVLRGSRGIWCLIEGYELRAEVLKRRQGAGAFACIQSIACVDGASLRKRAVTIHQTIAMAAHA